MAGYKLLYIDGSNILDLLRYATDTYTTNMVRVMTLFLGFSWINGFEWACPLCGCGCGPMGLSLLYDFCPIFHELIGHLLLN
jgi:hypothetical protein